MTAKYSVPDDAYAALGDETRLEILFELADHYDEAWSTGWLSFSALYDLVDIDDTSRFSYHLGKLQEEFVVKEREQYRPTIAALEVVTAIRSGTYADATTRETTIDASCPHCEAPLLARHHEHLLTLSCPDHGVSMGYPVPPIAASHQSLETLVDLVLRRHAAHVDSLRRGVCPYCWGPATFSFPHESVPEFTLQYDTIYARAACEACWMSYPIPIPDLLVSHPDIRHLYAVHDLEPPATQLGSLSLVQLSDVELLEDGKARVTISLEETTLVVDLEESGTVDICHRITKS
ncbi:winged helix-turn-helix transcriptional regulator [Natronolimnobius sp. AArcel1]|uniref:winged helix-turn-helix domain-containing protein n=1 Tax=Natronolimnobius sp. AArcel1 TaxID=1679093 RepID=UPI0013EB7CB0|nr:winged helix-turn-helix domain-containing protein [Natronolimnobius sp. AArcel1]NGM70793.1 winged helix-turn-helix transcriptional regulator [Natronolimnobius sp. AArcel1]